MAGVSLTLAERGLRSAGSELPTSSPTSRLVCSPPRGTFGSHALAKRSLAATPSPTTYLLGQALFCRLSRRPARAPANAPASEIDHRLSVRPETPEERQGPPGLLGRPLPACRTRSLSAAPPLRIRPLLTPTSLREDLRRGRRRLHGKQNARHPEMTSFSRPRTHGPHDRVPTLRRSRYRDRRKARYRLGRAPPRRAGFAPAGQQTKFHGVIASSNPNRPAEPGRTESTILASRFSRQCNSRNS